jgi:vacuolar iron transporter family protein
MLPDPRRANRMSEPQRKMHRSGRAGWLCAAVLGSDDAIVSTVSLMIAVAVSVASKQAILVAGVAGLVAGAMSMAVGEYVSARNILPEII